MRLEGIGIEVDDFTLNDGELVAGAVVIVKVIDEDNNVGLQIRHSGVNWLERGKMMQAAALVEDEILIRSIFNNDRD